jgi:hypothetical protein
MSPSAGDIARLVPRAESGPGVAPSFQNLWQLDHFVNLVSTEAVVRKAVVRNEHDDDLGSTVDTRDDVETDDYPATGDDFDAQEQEPEGTQGDQAADESIVCKRAGANSSMRSGRRCPQEADRA